MKRLRFSATISVLLVVAFLTPLVLYADGEWVTVGTRGFSAGSVQYVSAAVNGANVPYVAFRDNGLEGKAVLMAFDSSSGWGFVGNGPISTNTANYVSLAIGSDGVLYVAYQDQEDGLKPKVMKYAGEPPQWVLVGQSAAAQTGAYDISLALDSSNQPYVAYREASDSGIGRVVRYDGSNWVAVGTGFSAGRASYISLAVDSSNVPYVAFQDSSAADRLTVKRCSDATVWTLVGSSAGFSAGEAYFMSLALDKNNVPYVAYRDGGNSYEITVMRLDGNTWIPVGAPGFSTGAVKYPSLRFDGNGVPYVAFQDSANASEATVMRFDGSAWQTVGTAGFSEAASEYTSLAIDNSGTLFVAYRDNCEAAAYKATVKSYAYPLAVTLVSFDAVWEVDSVSVSWETAQEVDNLGFNLYHAAAVVGPWERLNDALIPAQNPGAVFGAVYEWVDWDVTLGEPVYYRLEDVDIHGVSTFHGPIAAVPQEPAAVTVAAFGAEGGSPALLLGLMGVALIVGRKRSRR